MAIVIDALEIVSSKKRLPCEAFFVDTNIIIYHRDPFAESAFDYYKKILNERVTNCIHYFRSDHSKCFSVISVAIEFYKFIQVGSYNIFTGAKKMDLEHFKKLRLNDKEFQKKWQITLKQYEKCFTKYFPLYGVYASTDIFQNFDGMLVDFGDYALFDTVMNSKKEWFCIFSNDSDFYSFPNDLYLLTLNEDMIKRAKLEGKIYS
ncbi:MAG: hypothetical protein AB1728_15160 [Bacteroidota bacterium]